MIRRLHVKTCHGLLKKYGLPALLEPENCAEENNNIYVQAVFIFSPIKGDRLRPFFTFVWNVQFELMEDKKEAQNILDDLEIAIESGDIHHNFTIKKIHTFRSIPIES